MAILQGFISLLTRSVGKIFSSLFDWAVIALFGRAEGGRKLLLSGLVGAAAIWPVLLVGIAAPKLALFVVAFIPLSDSVPAGVMRVVWIALAVLVPVTVGIVLKLQAPPDRPRPGWLGSIARGFPITLGLCAAFLILLITVPVLRISSAARGRQDVDVPLLTTGQSYELATKIVVATLRRHGFPMAETAPPWWSALPSAILQRVGREALTPYVPARSVYLRGGDLEVTLYPNALLLRGSVVDAARAHGLLAEALTGHADMLQTVTAEAQDIERQIQRVWTVYRENPEAHRNAWALSARLSDIAAEIARRSLSFDEWQVVYRQALQLSRALTGEPQLVEQALGQESAAAVIAPPRADSAYWLPTRVLLRRYPRCGVSPPADAGRAGANRGQGGSRGRARDGQAARRRRGGRPAQHERAAPCRGCRPGGVAAGLARGAGPRYGDPDHQRGDRVCRMAAPRARRAAGDPQICDGGRAMDQGKDRVGRGSGSTAVLSDRGAAFAPSREDKVVGPEQSGAHADGQASLDP